MQLKKMQATMGQLSATDVSRLRFGDEMAQGLRAALQASGAYRVDAVKAVSATEALTTAIRKQDLTVGNYFRSRKQLNNVLKEQWRLQNASMAQWSTDAKGRISGDMIIPRDAPDRLKSFTNIMNAAREGQISFGQAVNESRMRMGVFSQAIQSAALNTVNLGKNLQWSGRQLMVGLSLPFAAFGVVAGATALTVDKEMTRILKVYDYASQNMEDANVRSMSSMERHNEMMRERAQVEEASFNTAAQSAAAYGSKIEDTLSITSELAASGKSGVELQQATAAVNRGMLLGELDRQDAIKATISLQTVFGHSIRELGEDFNYLNALENATSLQMQDMVVAIPRLTGVVKSLGGDLQDIGTLMVAAKAGGIDAAEGANALKSVLFRANAPSGPHNERTFIEATNVSLEELRERAGGDGIKLLTLIGQKLEAIPDPGKKIAILKEVFGIYQGSKAGIIMEQLAKNTEQVARANEVAAAGAISWANAADIELKAIQESAAGRFNIAVQSMRASLAKLGEPFLEVAIDIVNGIGKIIAWINKIPEAYKMFAFWALAIGAMVGPLVMLTGLFMNFVGTIFKAGATFSLLISRFRAVSQEEAATALAAKMGTTAFLNQTTAAIALTSQIRQMSQALTELNMNQANSAAAAAAAAGIPLPDNDPTGLNSMERDNAPGQTSDLLGVTAGSLRAGGTENIGRNAARQTNEYLQARVQLQRQVNAGTITEEQMRTQLLQVEAANNPITKRRAELAAEVAMRTITQEQATAALVALERQLDPMLAYRSNIQAQIAAGTIREAEGKALILAEAQRIQAVEAARLRTEQTRQRAAAVGEKAGGGGALMGIATVGMMASTMGILSTETGNWVNTISMGVFAFSAMVMAAKAIKAAVAASVVVQNLFNIRVAASRMGMVGLTASTRAFGASVLAALGPFGLIAAAIAAVAAGLIYARKKTNEIKKEMEEWGDTAKRTGEQIGVSIGEGFVVAAGRAGEIADRVSQETRAEEQWRKENERSYNIISDTSNQDAAAMEVQRIGIDIFQATGSAEKAREAMLLAINGANNEGLKAKVNLDLDPKDIEKTMAQVSSVMYSDIQNDTRGRWESINDGFKEIFELNNYNPFSKDNWDMSIDSNDILEEMGLGEEAEGKARQMGNQIAEAYIGGSIEMFTARANAEKAALQGQMENLLDMGNMKPNDNDKRLLEEMGVDANSRAEMAQFFLHYDEYSAKYKGRVDELSGSIKNQAKESIHLRLAEQAIIQQLIDRGVINKDALQGTWQLGVATGILADGLQEKTDSVKGDTAATEENTAALEENRVETQKLVDAQKAAMQSAWGMVMGEMDRQMENQLKAEIEGITEAGQARLDDIESDAKAMDKVFDQRAKDLERKQDERKKKEEKVFDDRIKAIENTIEAEKKAEEQRQKIFEAEQQRIQRMADMFNQNVDFNVALNSGDMDAAAKLANNMRATESQWAIDDAMAASGEGSDARTAALEAQKEKVEEAKDSRMKEISDRDKAEKDALEATKARYNEDVEKQKEAEKKKTDSTRKATEERHRLMKEQLEADLAAWRAYIPKNEEDIKRHIGTLDGVYAKHDVTINTKSDQWSKSINAYIRTATETQRQELQNEEDWAAIGARAGEAMTAGMLGMSLEDFNKWSQAGAATSTNTGPGPMTTTQRPAGAPGGVTRHTGGIVDDSPGSRLGRPRSADLYPDEVSAILQRGEYVVDRSTTQRFGTGFFDALKESDSLIKGTFPRQRVPEAGDGIGLTAGVGEAMTRAFTAKMYSQLPSYINNLANAQIAAGQQDKIPQKIMDFIRPLLGTAAAGKYGGTNFSDEQLSNAAQIVSVGQGMGMSQRDLVIGLMTAMQESMLRNIPGGDRDSVGLFQQRPSQGWGSVEQIMNPKYSATKFFESLKAVEGRNGMSLTQAAQAVQRSAFPNAYAKWQDEAEAIMAAMAANGSSMMPGAEGIPYGTIGGTGGRGVNSIGDIIGLARMGGPAFRPTSTYRPGAVTTSGNASYHSTANAVDFGGPTPGRDTPDLLAINRHFAKFGRGLIELIYSGPGAINLRNGRPHTYSKAVQDIHHDHVHVAATKDTLAKLQMPSMRVGGEVKYDNTIANLHKKETVLTAPLSEGLKRGIQNLDQAGNSEYNITMDMRGSTIDSNFDIDAALAKAIDKRESRLGRTRKIK